MTLWSDCAHGELLVLSEPLGDLFIAQWRIVLGLSRRPVQRVTPAAPPQPRSQVVSDCSRRGAHEGVAEVTTVDLHFRCLIREAPLF